ncbi:MAG TPA: 4-oxalomesaconate tautomerase [Streptosporangiaceae bacterium]
MSAGVRCMMMRGGTSKGLYFLAGDLPAGRAERDALLLAIMGSGHPMQVDGLGGGHPLAAKVAVVSRPAGAGTEADADDDGDAEDGADLDYLFLQLGVAEPTITDRQNCGNILAGVGPFAAERGLITTGPEQTTARIRMVNSGSVVTATFATPGGRPCYEGDTAIAGVPGRAAPVLLRFSGTEGSATGSLLPTGRVTDVIDGVEVTCIDNGMPVVVARAADLGLTGTETAAELAADERLAARVDALRVAAGHAMGLGDVRGTSLPKTTLVSAPRDGGTISTRTFIPVQPHTAIGVLGAISVATALLLPGAAGAELAGISGRPDAPRRLDIEHPSGHLEVEVEVDTSAPDPRVLSAGVIRTARKLFDGIAYPASY